MTSVVLFDIDGTLLNTKELTRTHIYPKLSKFLGISTEQFKAVRDEYYQTLSKSTEYDPEAFLSLVASQLGGNVGELTQLFFEPEAFVQSVFEDVIDTLTQIQERGLPLGIYSEGTESYQRAKLNLTGLEKFLAPEFVFISNDKVAPAVLEKLPEDALMVDDRVEIVRVLNGHESLRPIWLNRADDKQELIAPTIHFLPEILDLL